MCKKILWSEEWKKKKREVSYCSCFKLPLAVLLLLQVPLPLNSHFLHDAAIGRMCLGTNPSQFAHLLMRK